MSVDISPKCRPRCRSSIGRVCRWSMLVEYRPRCQSISRPILHRHSTDSVGRYSADTPPTLHRHLADTRPTPGRNSANTPPTSHPTLGRYSTDRAGRYSTDISADTRPIVSFEISAHISADIRPTLNRHSTDPRPTLSGDTGPTPSWETDYVLFICILYTKGI